MNWASMRQKAVGSPILPASSWAGKCYIISIVDVHVIITTGITKLSFCCEFLAAENLLCVCRRARLSLCWALHWELWAEQLTPAAALWAGGLTPAAERNPGPVRSQRSGCWLMAESARSPSSLLSCWGSFLEAATDYRWWEISWRRGEGSGSSAGRWQVETPIWGGASKQQVSCCCCCSGDGVYMQQLLLSGWSWCCLAENCVLWLETPLVVKIVWWLLVCAKVYSEKQKCACLQRTVIIVHSILCIILAVTQALHLSGIRSWPSIISHRF